MAYALVTNTIATGGANSETTSGINTTGASLIVVGVTSWEGSTIGAVTDSRSNTWNALTAQAVAGDPRTQLFYSINPTVGAAHTFTYTATDYVGAITVAAFSGADLSAPFDQENGASSESMSSLQTGSITPTENNELVVTATNHNQASGTFTINSSMTITNQTPAAGANYGTALAYIIQTTAAAINPTWTFGGGSQNSAVVIASFKATAVVAARKGRLLLLGAGAR